MHVGEGAAERNAAGAHQPAQLLNQRLVLGPREPLLEHPGRFDGPAEVGVLPREANGRVDIVLVIACHFVRRPCEADIQMTVTNDPDLLDRSGPLLRWQLVTRLLLRQERYGEQRYKQSVVKV